MNSLEDMVEEAARTLGVEIPEEMPEEESKPISKSQRVRDYLEANPEARNKDIAAALDSYGVSPADVANTKAQMKKRAAKNGHQTALLVAAGSNGSSNGAHAVAVAPVAASAASLPEIDATVQLHLLEAGVEFVRKAGGINEAQHILGVIRRIRTL